MGPQVEHKVGHSDVKAPQDENPLAFCQKQSTGYQREYTRVDYAQAHHIRRKLLLKDHPEVSSLIDTDLSSALWVVLIVAFQAVMSYLLRGVDNWLLLFGLGYTIGAAMDHAMWVLVHDLTHDAVFKSHAWNMFWHLVANLPMLFPATVSFRHYHLMHHSYLNETYMDPDMPSLLEANVFGSTAVGKALWMLGFPIFQGLRMIRYSQEGLFDRWLFGNYLFQALYVSGSWYLLGPNAMFYLAVSSYFSISLHPLGARWVAEHYAPAPNQETYSYYGSANLIAFNIGYHNEHHDLPKVPWSKLPVLKKMAPEYYDSLVSHNSYFKIMWHFISDSNFTLKSRVVRWPKKKSS